MSRRLVALVTALEFHLAHHYDRAGREVLPLGLSIYHYPHGAVVARRWQVGFALRNHVGPRGGRRRTEYAFAYGPTLDAALLGARHQQIKAKEEDRRR